MFKAGKVVENYNSDSVSVSNLFLKRCLLRRWTMWNGDDAPRAEDRLRLRSKRLKLIRTRPESSSTTRARTVSMIS